MTNIRPNKAWIKNQLQIRIRSEWEERWTNSNDYKNTKLWFANLRPKCSKELLALPRIEAGLIIQFITNFSNLNHHTNKKDKRITPLCRICGDGREKPRHLATECDPLNTTSRLHLGAFQADTRKWDMAGLRSFVLSRSVRRLLTNRLVSPEESR